MNFTGLYFTIVLTASQLLKMMHADMTTRIQYDELPNPFHYWLCVSKYWWWENWEILKMKKPSTGN